MWTINNVSSFVSFNFWNLLKAFILLSPIVYRYCKFSKRVLFLDFYRKILVILLKFSSKFLPYNRIFSIFNNRLFFTKRDFSWHPLSHPNFSDSLRYRINAITLFKRVNVSFRARYESTHLTNARNSALYFTMSANLGWESNENSKNSRVIPANARHEARRGEL